MVKRDAEVKSRKPVEKLDCCRRRNQACDLSQRDQCGQKFGNAHAPRALQAVGFQPAATYRDGEHVLINSLEQTVWSPTMVTSQELWRKDLYYTARATPEIRFGPDELVKQSSLPLEPAAHGQKGHVWYRAMTRRLQARVSNPSTTVALIAVATCKARMLSFCNRHRILPEDVRLLFGGFNPSMGHGKRICSILKSEWSRQARLYRIHLEAQLHSSLGAERARRVLWHFRHLANLATESLWQCTLSQLRAYRRPKVRTLQGNRIYTEGDVTLPEDVSMGLALGPKFAVQPRDTGPELLSLVHNVSGLAPASEMDMCVSSGVDVLLRDQQEPGRPNVRRLASYLKTNSYCVFPSNKVVGFAVMPECEIQKPMKTEPQRVPGSFFLSTPRGENSSCFVSTREVDQWRRSLPPLGRADVSKGKELGNAVEANRA
ncbi:hypothetical protein HPB52_019575 [Rhipicephalus sanguineus]|uniref:Uncharacterized protein n=1 Tax=Rhipicephalus sanguineus TaxID=34632 RepID=A0A9D4TBG6_RHISA|nr:hypothetical protein HPB52_019575 [Rhipicephalus sanguineus]